MKDKIKTELIDEFLTTNKLSVDEFCKIAKISKVDLQKIYEQNFNFDIEKCDQNAVALFFALK